MEEKREYWAFISYRHLDNKETGREWATWLAREIETYEVPPELVGTKGSRGDIIPERIYPVFRDEDELSADADLSSPIYEALRNAKTVIVICSPRAVSSRYVGNEITYFKSLGRGDRVLAMMIEGEPHAAGDLECFPEALKHSVDDEGNIDTNSQVEPVAADFRLEDGRQGWHSPAQYREHFPDERSAEKYRERCDLAKLKLIAGILGVPLGKLIERDKAYQLALAKRRARIFTSVAAAMTILALFAVVAGIFAVIKQREEAVARERAEQSEQVALHARGTAENLIGEMLFDLGGKLDRFGRLDLLDDVSMAAKTYFDDLPEGQIDAETLRNRAVMLATRADILRSSGDLDGALALKQEALAISEKLLETNPNSFLNTYDQITITRQIGDILTLQNKNEAALEYFQRSLQDSFAATEAHLGERYEPLFAPLFQNTLDDEAARALAEAAEDEVTGALMACMAAAIERFGNISVSKEEIDKAISKYEITHQLNVAIAAANPADSQKKKNVQSSSQKLGNLAQKLSDFDRAGKLFQTEVDLAKKELESDPENAVWQSGLASALERLAGNYFSRDNPEQALNAATESLSLRRALAQKDPANMNYQEGLWVSLYQASLAAEGVGKDELADTLLTEAQEIAQSLVEIDPSNTEWQERLKASRDRKTE